MSSFLGQQFYRSTLYFIKTHTTEGKSLEYALCIRYYQTFDKDSVITASYVTSDITVSHVTSDINVSHVNFAIIINLRYFKNCCKPR